MKKFPKLSSKAILAPMSGVTDVAFRELCKKYGAGLTYTEFVSSAGLSRGNPKTKQMLKTSPLEKIKAVQLFGNNENELIKSVKITEKDFDIIDINCGCPAHKVTKIGAGSELLKNPEKIEELIKKLTKITTIPVTIKIRTGINNKNINAIEIAKLAEKAGASAIAVHGRTQKQGYSGKADWEIIKKVKQAVKIPVIGNGDVTSPEIFKKRLEQSGVDYIMVGRQAISNPYIFKQINDFLKKGKYKDKSKKEQIIEYLKLAQKYKIDFIKIKNYVIAMTKGMYGGAKFRKELSKSKNLKQLKNLLQNFK